MADPLPWVVADAGVVTAFLKPDPARRWRWLKVGLALVWCLACAMGAARLGGALTPVLHLVGLVPLLVTVIQAFVRAHTVLTVRRDRVVSSTAPSPDVNALARIARDPRAQQTVDHELAFADVIAWDAHPDGVAATLRSDDGPERPDPGRLVLPIPSERVQDVLAEIVPVWERYRTRSEDPSCARAALERLTTRA